MHTKPNPLLLALGLVAAIPIVIIGAFVAPIIAVVSR